MKKQILGTAVFCIWILSLGLGGCSAASKSRALVVDCENEKPTEINKEGFKKETKRQKKLDKINAQRLKDNK